MAGTESGPLSIWPEAFGGRRWADCLLGSRSALCGVTIPNRVDSMVDSKVVGRVCGSKFMLPRGLDKPPSQALYETPVAHAILPEVTKSQCHLGSGEGSLLATATPLMVAQLRWVCRGSRLTMFQGKEESTCEQDVTRLTRSRCFHTRTGACPTSFCETRSLAAYLGERRILP